MWDKPSKKRCKILELEKGTRWTNVHRVSMLRLELDVHDTVSEQ